MDFNTVILILAGAIVVTMTVIGVVAASLIGSARADKKNKSQIAEWLGKRETQTKEIAGLRADVQAVKNQKNDGIRDRERIFDRLRKLEEDVDALKDTRSSRRRRDDDDEDDYEAPRARRNGRYAR